MPLHLKRESLLAYLEVRFGGVGGFLNHWVSVRDGQQDGRSRSTLYGWLEKGLPRQPNRVFDFFGALDADPLAFLDVERSELKQRYAQIRLSFLLGGQGAGDFRPLFELYQPGPSWPPERVSRTHYLRSWHIYDFQHKAEAIQNAYAAIVVSPSSALLPQLPVVFHIAYRHGLANDSLWRPYGTVIKHDRRAFLFHENGHHQECDLEAGPGSLRFETFFGPSSVEFRLVSLHSFEAEIDFPSKNPPTLRFAGR